MVLFERTNGGTHPTVAGLEFLESAQRILAETDCALRMVRSRSRGENGRLTLGVYASLSTGNMFATLLEQRRRFPDVEVRTVDGSHDQLLSALTKGVVDIAMMTTSRRGWDDRTLPLWSERIIIALQANHPLSKKTVIRWQDLAGEMLLIPQNGSGPELERLLITKRGDYDPRHLSYQDSGLDRLLSLVAAGYGGLLMLEGATGLQYEGVTNHEVHDEEGPSRLNFMAYWRQSNRNPTLSPFLALLRQRYPDLSGMRLPD